MGMVSAEGQSALDPSAVQFLIQQQHWETLVCGLLQVSNRLFPTCPEEFRDTSNSSGLWVYCFNCCSTVDLLLLITSRNSALALSSNGDQQYDTWYGAEDTSRTAIDLRLLYRRFPYLLRSISSQFFYNCYALNRCIWFDFSGCVSQIGSSPNKTHINLRIKFA